MLPIPQDAMEYEDLRSDLMQEWRNKHEGKGVFVSDGIVHPETWYSMTYPKILFILREANTAKGSNFSWDLARWLEGEPCFFKDGKYCMGTECKQPCQGCHIDGCTYNRIAEWIWGITENMTASDYCSWLDVDKTTDESLAEYERRKRCLIRRAAVMNIKKIGGGPNAVLDSINSFASADRNLLCEQIHIIKPDIIVLCGTKGPFERFGFDGDTGCKSQIIESWHPNARISAQTMFSNILSQYHNKEHISC